MNMKEASRGSWSASNPPTLENINVGSLQRIADATETIAQNYGKLIRERDQAIKERDYERQETKFLEHRIRSLRGVITRLKNART